jgi:hypothetical protein
VDGSLGLNLGLLKIGGGGGWSHSTSIMYDQSVTIEVGPGQMVCFFVLAPSLRGPHSTASRASWLPL